jgi:hypothetical protein
MSKRSSIAEIIGAVAGLSQAYMLMHTQFIQPILS